MHPREFFWFSNTAYRRKVSGRDLSDLEVEAARKRLKIAASRNMIPLDILFAVLSHGACIWLFLIDVRAIEVGDKKLAIINAELSRRASVGAAPPPPPPTDQEIAYAVLSRLDDKEIAAVTKALKDRELNTPGQPSRSSSHAGSSNGDDEQPPPYTKTETHTMDVSMAS